MAATPTNLFGETLSAGLNDLTQTLKNAATVVAKDPNRLATMVGRLSDIEGKNLNLRGILFELFVAYLVRDEGHWLEVGSLAKDPKSRKTAEIDVLVDISRRECMAVECKAKVPGGELSVEEVEKWIGRLSIWQSWMKEHQTRREASHSFQIWTTGTISPEALSLLQREKQKRTKILIDWKDGDDVREYAALKKEGRVRDAFDQHFFKHPLAEDFTPEQDD